MLLLPVRSLHSANCSKTDLTLTLEDYFSGKDESRKLFESLHGKDARWFSHSFHHKDTSPRWKEIVEPKPGRLTHHLELYSTSEMDDEAAGGCVRHGGRLHEIYHPHLSFAS